MPDLKDLIKLRVTACKKMIEGSEETLVKRIAKIEAKRGQAAANVEKMEEAAKKAGKAPQG